MRGNFFLLPQSYCPPLESQEDLASRRSGFGQNVVPPREITNSGGREKSTAEKIEEDKKFLCLLLERRYRQKLES